MRPSRDQAREDYTHRWVPIGTLNVRGLSGNAEAVDDLIQAHGVQFLALTETWLRPMDPIPLPYRTENTCLPPYGQRYRGQGGVTLVIKPNITYRVVDKVAAKSHQLIAIKVRGITIIALYLSPSLPRTRIMEILKHIQRIARGPTVIAGDLNGRHPSWEVGLSPGQGNAQGKAIHHWAKQNGWNIRGTVAPTYESIHGKSTIDLLLVRGMPVKGPIVVYGPWDGASDHHPIKGEINLNISPDPRTKKLPKACRDKEHMRTRATELYEREFRRLAEKVDECYTKEQLETAYAQMERTIVQPWNRDRYPRPNRFKEFWTTELDHLAKKKDTAI